MKFWHNHKWEYFKIGCFVNTPMMDMRYNTSVRKCAGCGLYQKEIRAGVWAAAEDDIVDRFSELAHKMISNAQELESLCRKKI